MKSLRSTLPPLATTAAARTQQAGKSMLNSSSGQLACAATAGAGAVAAWVALRA